MQLDVVEKQIYGLDVLNKNLKQTINNYNGLLIGSSTYEFLFDDRLGSDVFGNLIVVLLLIILFILTGVIKFFYFGTYTDKIEFW
jgi:hypothetical protein